MAPRLIALEEHFYSQAVYGGLDIQFKNTIEGVPRLFDQLRNIDEQRLSAMDEGDVALQVISHAFTPGSPNPQTCIAGNNEVATKIAQQSGNQQEEASSRFAAFAVLPVSDPIASAQELRRCVSEHNFVGALIDNHANGKHFDGSDYDALWSAAVELDVPIYLHPTFPTPDTMSTFMGNYPPSIGVSLGAASWGWHSDVGLHVLKLFAAGVFDRFPTLKIIVGHMGEMLPFMLERVGFMSESFAGGWAGRREREWKRVWDENVWITTSGVWSLAPMKCLLENTRVERIMFSVDYPFEESGKGKRWFEQLEASGLLSVEELELVGWRNAEMLLGLRRFKE